MEPLLRAAADRLIHHGGFLRYVASHASALGPERTVETTGLTVLQTLGSIVLRLEDDLTAIEQLAAGRTVAARPQAAAGDIDAAIAGADVAALLDRYAAARDALIARYETLPQSFVEGASSSGARMGEVLLAWTANIERHALDFADALPEIAFDPLLLDWALYAALPEADRGRQQSLRQRAREYYASLPPREEADGEEW